MLHAPPLAPTGSRFTQITPVTEIEPYQGWSLFSDIDADGDGFTYCEYYARGPKADVHLPVSRFAFHPTQDRFEWLVRNGFAQKPARHCSGPWDDQDIDRELAAERRAVAA
ncbi:hypothetical protein [Novosphingobium gossypii]|uniref:hypothetical protein n=1 Tax=Novosphingobium gossypii TaxID=1604774 RepID=UPI003D25046E